MRLYARSYSTGRYSERPVRFFPGFCGGNEVAVAEQVTRRRPAWGQGKSAEKAPDRLTTRALVTWFGSNFRERWHDGTGSSGFGWVKVIFVRSQCGRTGPNMWDCLGRPGEDDASAQRCGRSLWCTAYRCPALPITPSAHACLVWCTVSVAPIASDRRSRPGPGDYLFTRGALAARGHRVALAAPHHWLPLAPSTEGVLATQHHQRAPAAAPRPGRW